MTKSEIMEALQITATIVIMFAGRSVSKAKMILDDYDKLKDRLLTLENSDKAAWKYIDRLKNRLNENGVNKG